MKKSVTSVVLNYSSRVSIWLGIALLSIFPDSDVLSKIKTQDFGPNSIESEFQKEGNLELHLLNIPEHDSFCAMDSEEFPREITEYIEYDDDDDRRCISSGYCQRSREKMLFHTQNALFHKQSNTLYILYCSLRIHLS